MAGWEIVGGPREYEPSGGADAEVGWAYDLQRGGEQRTVRVEVSRTAAVVLGSGGPIDDDARRAARTKGKTAIQAWLGEDELPPEDRIVIHTEGFTRPESE